MLVGRVVLKGGDEIIELLEAMGVYAYYTPLTYATEITVYKSMEDNSPAILSEEQVAELRSHPLVKKVVLSEEKEN